MSPSRRGLVCVGVFGLDGALISKATAALEPIKSGASGAVELTFDRSLGGHVGRNVPPATYVLSVSADGLEAQRREVAVSADGLSETVILGRTGLPFYYRGAVKVPYEPVPLIGISFAGASGPDNVAIGTRFRLEPVLVEKAVLDQRVRVFRAPAGSDAERLAQIATELSRLEGVRHAGPVVAFRRNSVAFVTNEFFVKFKPAVQRDEGMALIAGQGLTVRQSIAYARNTFLVDARDARSGLAACQALVESGRVEYAEPNLVSTSQDDVVMPTDFLISKQWHIPLVNLPGAWSELQLLNGPGVAAQRAGDLTFGSENITIAIFDRGIPSQTLVSGMVETLHPDFKGAVTSGSPKISQYFDFAAMVANNDNTVENHGVKCAGIAAAFANNPSPVLGELEGVVGAAPNCRVMAIMRDVGGTEKAYADAYIWMAGLDPKNTDPGFPTPLASGEGADVISSSFGLDGTAGAPISGLMKDCFDTVTTDGRDGKGAVLCFSVGNVPVDYRLQRPWAAYEKTIAVASTTDRDTKSPFGGFGPGIEVCAPGGNGLNDLVTCDLPTAGTIEGHTGGSFDYTQSFAGTSASTPLVAGIAALMLSANPNLTWSEVLEILCDTAMKVDPANTDPVGQWRDTDGDGVTDYSDWYGCGRVDAKAAVVAAAAAARREEDVPDAPRNLRIVT